MAILDEDVYRRSPALMMAFREGQLAMLEEIRNITNSILMQSNLNPFRVQNEYENGQLYVLNSVVETLTSYEQNLCKQPLEVGFDA